MIYVILNFCINQLSITLYFGRNFHFFGQFINFFNFFTIFLYNFFYIYINFLDFLDFIYIFLTFFVPVKLLNIFIPKIDFSKLFGLFIILEGFVFISKMMVVNIAQFYGCFCFLLKVVPFGVVQTQ